MATKRSDTDSRERDKFRNSEVNGAEIVATAAAAERSAIGD